MTDRLKCALTMSESNLVFSLVNSMDSKSLPMKIQGPNNSAVKRKYVSDFEDLE